MIWTEIWVNRLSIEGQKSLRFFICVLKINKSLMGLEPMSFSYWTQRENSCSLFLTKCQCFFLCVCVVSRLTASAASMGVHKWQGHPLVLLQSALISETALHGAHHITLLLPVCNGGLIHVHRLPTEETERKGWGGGRDMEREGNEREMRRVRGVGEREREDHHSAATPLSKMHTKKPWEMMMCNGEEATYG